jgi:hypothetical protein
MYSYQTEREKVFTEAGQVLFLKIRDKTHELVRLAGAVKLGRIVHGMSGGDTWLQMACIDRLVELKEVVEVPQERVQGQDRVFCWPADYVDTTPWVKPRMAT